MVNDDHNITCAQGLHIASINYLKTGWNTSGKNLKVEVDPRDVISIPYDYADSKARVCKYRVVEDITGREKEYGF